MTIKELLLSVDLPSIIKTLIKRYGATDSLRPLYIYKQDYDTLRNIEFSGDGGTVTYNAEMGESNIHMIEGDSFRNITGYEIAITPDTFETRVAAAAEILWCASPFGNWTSLDRDALSDYLCNSPATTLNENAKRARRFYFLQDLHYCRDKKMRRELLAEMNRPVDEIDEVALSLETMKWLRFNTKRKLNRSKRKRRYRLRKRYEELVQYDKRQNFLNYLRCTARELPLDVIQYILKSQAINSQSYTSNNGTETERIDYVSDLLLNPLYNNPNKKAEDIANVFLCIIFTSHHAPCSDAEFRQLNDALEKKFEGSRYYLFTAFDDDLSSKIRLEINDIHCYLS